jgi:ABC-2 type transport system ATP-binding protein
VAQAPRHRCLTVGRTGRRQRIAELYRLASRPRVRYTRGAGLRALGMTVFLTTHYMDEAEYLADRVAVIAAGQIVAEGTPGTLGGRERAAVEIRFSLPDGTDVTDLPVGVQACVIDRSGTRLVLKAQAPLDVLGPLVPWAQTNGHDLDDLDVRRPSLEDIYRQLTAPDGAAPP